MDTKTLYDWAVEAGLDFDPSRITKAAEVWHDRLMGDTDWLDLYWLKFLIDGMARCPKHAIPHRMASYHDGCNSIRRMHGWAGDSTIRAYADGVHADAAVAGADMINIVSDEARAWVMDNAALWWEDVVNYHKDMEVQS
jgi:hypothetical protein